MFQSKNSNNNTTAIVQGIRVIVQTLFSGLLILYLVLLISENLFKGFVSNTFNLDILLLPIVLSGIIFVVIPDNAKIVDYKIERNKALDWVLIILFSVIGFAAVYYKMNSLGMTAWVLSIAAGLVIFSIGVMMLLSDNSNQHKTE